ncbi:hypothetical protein EVAR_78577_1 [Eumeta japonica]|uniref:Uncharacterized protein n=1 Tax=Eumeta variegata TaxID=151549 RepID=A0A4C1W9R7_EUMVA|nr:hypothetical protein EVAR_78577_1 [Eumeta japonica]
MARRIDEDTILQLLLSDNSDEENSSESEKEDHIEVDPAYESTNRSPATRRASPAAAPRPARPPRPARGAGRLSAGGHTSDTIFRTFCIEMTLMVRCDRLRNANLTMADERLVIPMGRLLSWVAGIEVLPYLSALQPANCASLSTRDDLNSRRSLPEITVYQNEAASRPRRVRRCFVSVS